MSKTTIGIGAVAFVAGVAVGNKAYLLTEPGWAKKLKSRIALGGLSIATGASLSIEFCGVSNWAGAQVSNYLVWSRGSGFNAIVAHINLVKSSIGYTVEIFHSWIVPRAILLHTTLPITVTIDKDFILVVIIPLSALV